MGDSCTEQGSNPKGSEWESTPETQRAQRLLSPKALIPKNGQETQPGIINIIAIMVAAGHEARLPPLPACRPPPHAESERLECGSCWVLRNLRVS